MYYVFTRSIHYEDSYVNIFIWYYEYKILNLTTNIFLMHIQQAPVNCNFLLSCIIHNISQHFKICLLEIMKYSFFCKKSLS